MASYLGQMVSGQTVGETGRKETEGEKKKGCLREIVFWARVPMRAAGHWERGNKGGSRDDLHPVRARRNRAGRQD